MRFLVVAGPASISNMAFFQQPPSLGNQYASDSLLREHLERMLPAEILTRFEPVYRELGERAGGELYRASLADQPNEPKHVMWDAWGERVDRIEVTEVWKVAQRLSAEYGLVAAGYDAELGSHARTHQHAMNYLVQASLDTYSCPLAMTDGAARVLLDSGDAALIDHALPKLLSRDPDTMWTSGQWMTERIGGSDVSQTETIAKRDGDGWRLFGTKWFTSASTSEMAITLARPEGNPPGGHGLAVFYLELRDQEGRLRDIQVNRLKDKLGTRKLPTAELTLAGTPARLVGDPKSGIRGITPMLNITRTWNTVAAATGMRRAVALAVDYAGRREAFGTPLRKMPLHVDTLAGLVAEAEGAFMMAFRLVELLGRTETGEANAAERAVLRFLTSIAKLTTGKQAVAVASETLECFGGAGYVHDTGLPRLLTDAQVLPIWEGTTNVLSLDSLKVLRKEGVWDAFVREVCGRFEGLADPRLEPVAEVARSAIDHAGLWLSDSVEDRDELEAGARRFALTAGRALELALLAEHAQWCLDSGKGERALAVARRFSMSRIDDIADGLRVHDARAVFER